MVHPVPTSACVSLTTIGRPSSRTLDCMQAILVVKPAHTPADVPEHVNIGADVCAALKITGGREVVWGTPTQSNAYADGTASICRIHTPFRATADVEFLTELCAAIAMVLRMDVATLAVDRECAYLTLKTRERNADADEVGGPVNAARAPESALPPRPLARAERYAPPDKTSSIASLLDVAGLFPPVSELLFGTGNVEVMPPHRSVDEWVRDPSARLALPKRSVPTHGDVDQQTKVTRTLERDRTRILGLLRDGMVAGII